MKKKELSESTEQQLSDKAKASKSSAFLNATLIGFMFGIIVWSVSHNTVGFFTLIPLYFIYKVMNKDKALEE